MNADEFRTAGHRLINTLAEQLDHVEEQPLFPSRSPTELHDDFDEPMPTGPTPIDQIISDVVDRVLPHCTQINHPGYLGLITPTPTPVGILGHLIASALNQNVGVWSSSPVATTIERRVIRWLNDLIGYGPDGGGNLTSGGLMANFVALKLARDWATGDHAQHDGVTQPLAVYTSEERHISVDKSVDAIGIGRKNLRIIATDDQFRIDLDLLHQAIAKDRAAGVTPIAIVAMGGSTNTGVVDPLRELKHIADREKMWLHVDAAYGGGMLVSKKYAKLLDGIDLADSVTIDPHKWYFAPLDAGAILVKDAGRLIASFGLQPPYLKEESGQEQGRYNFYVHSFEQSRRFRGLKVWMSMKRYGADQVGEWVDANVDHALRLYDLFRIEPDFAIARKPIMSAICIRYQPPGFSENDLGKLHAQVVKRIEEGGRFWFSTTMLKGKWYFRICPVNFRTRIEHMDELHELLVDECAAETSAERV